MRKMVVLLLAAVVAAISLPATHASEYTERSDGYVVYFPTIAQADQILAEQLPNGLVPERVDSAVVVADDAAAKLLVLAASYRHTNDTRYLEGYSRLAEALKRVNSTYGYVPRYFRVDGSALSVWDDRGAVQDAITLATLLGGQPLPENVTAEATVTVACTWSEDNETAANETEEAEAETCPYLTSYNEYGEEVTDTAAQLVYSPGEEKSLRVKYTVPVEALRKDRLTVDDIQVLEVYATKDGEEVLAEPDDCVLRGIQVKLLPRAREDMLAAIARELLVNPEMRRGFVAASANEPRTVLEKVAYQAAQVVLGKGAVPDRILKESHDARDYLSLTQEYSLLQGGIYLPWIGKDNSTVSYTVSSRRNVSYSEHSPNIAVNGSEVSYTYRGLEPRAEPIWIVWRPVEVRRVHVAGSFSALMEAKFGVSLSVDDVVRVEPLPSGEYHITVNRQKVFDYETLEGTVKVRKPVGVAKNTVVQFPTLTIHQAMRAYREAIEQEDPEKLFVAADNLMIYRTGASVADLSKGTSGVLKAMYSLSDTDIERVASSNNKLKRTLYKWKQYYAEKSLRTAQELVKISLESDRYDPSLQKLLWRLATEANLTGLPTAKALNDLYAGYVAYFGPHTKNYQNIALMARHLPEYQEIIAAIDSGNYDRAKELLEALPANSTVRQILEQKVNEPFQEVEELRNEALAAVRDALEGAGSTDEALKNVQEYLSLATSVGRSDAEMELVLSVLKGYSAGVVSRENAKIALSDISYFKDWSLKPVLPQTKPQEEELPNVTGEVPSVEEEPPESTWTNRVFGTVIVLTVVVLTAGIAYRRLKRRKGETEVRRR
jgi:hypothetical protein